MRHQLLRSSVKARSLPMGAAACLAGTLLAPSVLAQQARYTITDLGTIPGSTVCVCFFGIALSNEGHAIGRFFGADGNYHGFLWHDGTMIDIGSLGGGVTQVLDVNDLGTATGLSEDKSGESHAFIFRDNAMTDLGTLGGIYSVGAAINNAGDVAGDAQTGGRDQLQRAVLWQSGERPEDLGTFGGEYSVANGINDTGHVVGWAWDAQRRQRGFLWSPANGLLDLGDLAGHPVIAHGLNDADAVVGSANAPGDPAGRVHAFLWTPSDGIIDLGVLAEAGRPGQFGPELVSTSARAINSAGQVVGNSFPGTNDPPLRPGPFLWEKGAMTNLNDLIDPDAGWVIVEANDINDRGQIIGTARSATALYRAVILSPASVCAPDFNADGTLNSQDFFDFLRAFFAGEADFNADGTTNSQDFFDYVAAFFVGCNG